MPQLDKVTFYLQMYSIIFVFLIYHFYAVKYIIRPLYAILKIRETCFWWFDFDRDLTDWWLGEYETFMRLTYSFSLRVTNLLNIAYPESLCAELQDRFLLRRYEKFYKNLYKTFYLIKLDQCIRKARNIKN
jgi:hypothetical protein